MKTTVGLIALFFSFSCVNAQQDLVQGFGEGVAVAVLKDRSLDEISGLACSRVHPGTIYIHNDSGGEAVVYWIDSLGNRLGEIKLLETENRDWEDIAVGPRGNGGSYIYVGEIGDNNAVYEEVVVYRFPEPSAGNSNSEVIPEKIKLTYPGGARDAESLMVDPISGDVFILSKRDSLNMVYRLPSDKFGTGEAELEEMIKLPFTNATAADISADGSQIVVKNYLSIYFWKRNIGETVARAMGRAPVELPYSPEPQGEAIGFRPDGKAYYTLSEKRFDLDPVLYKYTANPH